MLVLSRKEGESVTVGNATIRVYSIGAGRVRLAIDAPPEIKVLRSELQKRGEELPGPIANEWNHVNE